MTALLLSLAFAHDLATERVIGFPDVPGYQVLVCDLHVHTAFSDGQVWPDLRVAEAARDGLDCIAITEHLEHQPHAEDLPHPDRNRAFAIADKAARRRDVLVIPGAEVTRDMPPGHSNALFVEDANLLLKDAPRRVFAEAHRQGAFVFWNHPHWEKQRPDGIARLEPLHVELIEKGWLSGIEVVNDRTFSDEALELALAHDLAILASSDIHGLIDWRFGVPQGGHRPVTLIFATERSLSGIAEALQARRTVAYDREMLIGRERELLPLLEASLTVTSPRWLPDTTILEVGLENRADGPLTLRNVSDYRLHSHADLFRVDPGETVTLQVKTGEKPDRVELSFEVLSALTAPDTHPVLTVAIDAATLGTTGD